MALDQNGTGCKQLHRRFGKPACCFIGGDSREWYKTFGAPIITGEYCPGLDKRLCNTAHFVVSKSHRDCKSDSKVWMLERNDLNYTSIDR
jgi:hypothetical protein